MGAGDLERCPADPRAWIGALTERLQPLAVILFGSRARGEEGRLSDWDILVIADGLPQHFLRRMELLDEGMPIGVDAFGFTPAEIRENLHRAIILDAALDGVALVGDIAWLRDLATRYLRENGLRRVPAGYVH